MTQKFRLKDVECYLQTLKAFLADRIIFAKFAFIVENTLILKLNINLKNTV
jgi:hypothetical protein